MSITFGLPFKGVQRVPHDVPKVRIESGPVVSLIRLQGVTIPLTDDELMAVQLILQASEDAKHVAKLLESYDRHDILSLIDEALDRK